MRVAIFKNNYLHKRKKIKQQLRLPGKTIVGFSIESLPHEYVWKGNTYNVYLEELEPVVPGKFQTLQPAETGEMLGDKYVIPQNVVSLPLDDIRKQLKREIKALAGQKIIDRFPLHQQHNMNMRANTLQEIRMGTDTEPGRNLTAEEKTERQELIDNGQWVEDVRQASKDMRRDLKSMTFEQLQSYDIETDPRWPA